MLVVTQPAGCGLVQPLWMLQRIGVQSAFLRRMVHTDRWLGRLPCQTAWDGARKETGYIWLDSGKNIILQAPYNSVTAEIGPVEPFIKIEPGVPDGLCVCSDGSLWVAQWGGGRVCRFDADGRLACELRLPVSQPTSCAVDREIA